MSGQRQRQLVILLDGTRNSPEEAERWPESSQGTNVQALRDILGESSATSPLLSGGGRDEFTCELDNTDRIVYYNRGLGARPENAQSEERERYTIRALKTYLWKLLPFDKALRAWAAICADGIIGHMVQAYCFLMFNYQEGASIFIFGFSRGAYTARLLISMLRAYGVMKTKGADSAHTRKQAIVDVVAAYTTLKNRDGYIHDFAKQHSISSTLDRDGQKPLITFLGLFDTVAGPIKPGVVDHPYLSSMVQYARHALAINEQRDYFKPLIWLPAPKLAEKNTISLQALRILQQQETVSCPVDVNYLEERWVQLATRNPSRDQISELKAATPSSLQMWFAGAHADVGGGYPDDARVASVTLLWMLAEAVRLGGLILKASEFISVPKKQSFRNWLIKCPSFRSDIFDKRIQGFKEERELPWLEALRFVHDALSEAERCLLQGGDKKWLHDSYKIGPQFAPRIWRALCRNSPDEAIHQTVWDLWQGTSISYAPSNVRRVLMARAGTLLPPYYRNQIKRWKPVTSRVYATKPETEEEVDGEWYIHRTEFKLVAAIAAPLSVREFSVSDSS